jgi:hypothetical protein
MNAKGPFLYVKFTKACTWCRREFSDGVNNYFTTDPDDPSQNEYPVSESEYKARRISEILLYEEAVNTPKQTIYNLQQLFYNSNFAACSLEANVEANLNKEKLQGKASFKRTISKKGSGKTVIKTIEIELDNGASFKFNDELFFDEKQKLSSYLNTFSIFEKVSILTDFPEQFLGKRILKYAEATSKLSSQQQIKTEFFCTVKEFYSKELKNEVSYFHLSKCEQSHNSRLFIDEQYQIVNLDLILKKIQINSNFFFMLTF